MQQLVRLGLAPREVRPAREAGGRRQARPAAAATPAATNVCAKDGAAGGAEEGAVGELRISATRSTCTFSTGFDTRGGTGTARPGRYGKVR